MNTMTMTINGQSVAGQATFKVINPATEQSFAEVPDATREQLNEAVAAAKKALSSWAADANKRREAIGKIPAVLQDAIDELAMLITKEQGKPLANARSEVGTAIGFIRNTLEEQPLQDIMPTHEGRTTFVLRRPIGVVAAITPWNYPLLIAVSEIISAIFMGNTVVLKPAPTTPVATLRFGELVRDILPAGVVNIISGPDQLGAWLVEHPDIAKISFTGSVATGQEIAKVAARDLKRVTLELGGNDPSIVLADSNVKEQAKSIFWGAFSNCGQICVASKRLYVHESLFEPMVKALTELAQRVVVGDGQTQGVEMGPLNNKEQLARVEELVADAKAHGATIHTGGQRIAKAGYFYQPTIVTGIKEGVRLVDEEQFGPVLPVMSFKTEQEAVERANSTPFGLGASVWSGSVDKARAIADQLQAGTVWINHMFGDHPYAPFGGFKQSGIGRSNGVWGLEGMAEIQTITVPND